MSSLVTGEAVALDVQSASLASRAISCLIDTLAYVGGYTALVFAAGWLLDLTAYIDSLLSATLGIVLLVIGLVAVPTAVETLSGGRSLGKLVTGSRVVREDGGPIGMRHALIRATLWVFEVVMTGGGIAALSGLLSPQSKRLGDHMAGTLAVYERVRMPAPVPIVPPAHLAGWIASADVSAVPAGLVHRCVNFLTTADRFAPESRWTRAIELATLLNPHVAPAPPEGTLPEAYLAAVIARRRSDALATFDRGETARRNFSQRVGSLPHGLHL